LPIKCKSQSLATKWPLQSLHLTPEKPLLVLGGFAQLICSIAISMIHLMFFIQSLGIHDNEGIYFCYCVNLTFPLLIYILIF
jgi:hypothetical protein